MTEVLMFRSGRCLGALPCESLPASRDVSPLLFPETGGEPSGVTRTGSVVYPQAESLKYSPETNRHVSRFAFKWGELARASWGGLSPLGTAGRACAGRELRECPVTEDARWGRAVPHVGLGIFILRLFNS